MSHSHERQEARNTRWQQRQREENREMNRNRLEHHIQGEHSGQGYDHEAENRWENDPAQNYAYPRQSNSEQPSNDEYDSRYDSRSRPESWKGPRYREPESSNREWVSGTGQPPYRQERPGYPRRSESGPRPSFAGRGPQGYKRSDDRIMEDINEEMTRDHDLDASDISVEAKGGEVILKGTVSDRESKRRAEEIAESCSGVKDVQNQIRIKRENSSDSERDSRDEKGDKGNDKRSTKLAS
jgi:hypothetical protein